MTAREGMIGIIMIDKYGMTKNTTRPPGCSTRSPKALFYVFRSSVYPVYIYSTLVVCRS
jgi:hypothetical protein